jgi:hypothetical protein
LMCMVIHLYLFQTIILACIIIDIYCIIDKLKIVKDNY